MLRKKKGRLAASGSEEISVSDDPIAAAFAAREKKKGE